MGWPVSAVGDPGSRFGNYFAAFSRIHDEVYGAVLLFTLKQLNNWVCLLSGFL